tara:strand:+ start:3087 stop:3812 length:726 start_codon:yes stop_codon:yes gene_type:complete
VRSSIKKIAMKNSPLSILVVAAHPDDEILGCGGTMAKHVTKGDEVNVLIMAEGVTSRDSERDREKRENELSELTKAAKIANDIIGANSIHLHDFPDNRLDSIDLLDLIITIEFYINKYQPSIVYTHHRGDVNIDHKIVHDAVLAATRPQPGNCVKTLLFFEIASSTEWTPPQSIISFHPNWFIDISDTLEIKLQALEAYVEEMRTFPHPRSIDGIKYLSKWRGANVGVDSCEAFILGRNIL